MNNYESIVILFKITFILFLLPIRIDAQSDNDKQLSYCYNKFYGQYQKIKKLSELESDLYFDVTLRCGAELEKNGDTTARNIILNYFDSELEELKKSHFDYSSLKEWLIAYGRLGRILKTMTGKEVFTIGMKYFSQNICVFDFIDSKTAGDTPNTNLGLLAYENLLLKLMTEDNKLHYRKIYSSLILKRARGKKGEDADRKKLHEVFYPIIKADWEAGKIKLKEK